MVAMRGRQHDCRRDQIPAATLETTWLRGELYLAIASRPGGPVVLTQALDAWMRANLAPSSLRSHFLQRAGHLLMLRTFLAWHAHCHCPAPACLLLLLLVPDWLTPSAPLVRDGEPTVCRQAHRCAFATRPSSANAAEAIATRVRSEPRHVTMPRGRGQAVNQYPHIVTSRRRWSWSLVHRRTRRSPWACRLPCDRHSTWDRRASTMRSPASPRA